MIRGDLGIINKGIHAGNAVVIIDEVKKGEHRKLYINSMLVMAVAAADGYACVRTDGTPLTLYKDGKPTLFQPALISKDAIALIAGKNVDASD